VKKIMDKAPLKYALARNLAFLDPREMGATAKEKNLDRCKAVLRQLNEADRVSDNDVVEIIEQYRHYIDEIVVPRCSEFKNFCVSTSRLDELLFDTMADNTSSHKLWSCVNSFSFFPTDGTSKCRAWILVNKQIEADNLAEDTFVAKRIVTMSFVLVACRTLMPAISISCWQPLLPDRSTYPTWKTRRRKRNVVEEDRSANC